MNIRESAREALQGVSVAWLLALREWHAEYRQSRMVLVWPLVQPLAYTALFILLRPIMGGSLQHDPMVFAVFVFLGFTLWQSWFEVLRSEMDAIRRHKGLMSRGELGLPTLVLATAITGFLQLIPKLVLLVAAALVLLDADARAVTGLIAFAFLTLANGAAIGALLQPFATLSPDLGKTIQSLSLGLMVTGAVFYPLPERLPDAIRYLLAANPMGTLLDAARAPLFAQPMASPWAVAAWVALTAGLAFALPYIGRRVLPIVIERLGG